MSSSIQGQGQGPGWFVRFNKTSTSPIRLFLFPHAGSGVTAYRPFATLLEPSAEVHVILLPGREARFNEPPFRSLAPLLDALTPRILPLLDRPFAFFGHSMGSLIAFELCRRLRRMEAPLPFALFASARPSPQEKLRDENLHLLSDSELIEELREYGDAPPQVLANAELMELLLPMVRADFSVNETYIYAHEPPLPIPIVALGGERDSAVPQDKLEAWREQTSMEFFCRIFPGDHFYLKPQQSELISLVKETLTRFAPR